MFIEICRIFQPTFQIFIMKNVKKEQKEGKMRQNEAKTCFWGLHPIDGRGLQNKVQIIGKKTFFTITILGF